MKDPWAFMVGLIAILIGTVGLTTGRGYILGRSAEGWSIPLLALICLLAGLAIAVLGGMWGII